MWRELKMRKHTLLSLLAFGSIVLSGCYVDLGFIQLGNKVYDEKKQAKEIASYYADIDDTEKGSELLQSLRTLNLAKREKTIGYADLGKYYNYTDYDPAHVKFNKSGIPYSGHILSFYSGKSVLMGDCDREHVWPASRLKGGRDNNIVDSDIYMARPTCSEENQARGNSAYVTGMNDERNGWDPVTAFGKTLGVYEGIRGECARIIFYCCTIDPNCQIVESAEYEGNGVPKMGVLSDLIEWACENPVNDREKRRQVGGQYLQGNRNAFVDHPEYACKIWGSGSDRAKAACSKAGYATN